MEIKSSGNKIMITGNIKSINHYQSIANELDKLKNSHQNITIYIYDSISITSSVIGHLCKLVSTTNLALSLFVENDSLHSLLSELNLIQTLNVKKINNQ